MMRSGGRILAMAVCGVVTWQMAAGARAAGTDQGAGEGQRSTDAGDAPGTDKLALFGTDFQQGMQGGWQFRSGSWGTAPEPDNYSNKALRAKGSGIIECGKSTW